MPSSEPTKLIKSIICPQCKQRINFTIGMQELGDLKVGQLVNFSLMHARDHTLVVSVDKNGDIRRERVSKIQQIESYEEKEAEKEQLTEDIVNHKIVTDLIVEKSDNLQTALIEFLKN